MSWRVGRTDVLATPWRVRGSSSRVARAFLASCARLPRFQALLRIGSETCWSWEEVVASMRSAGASPVGNVRRATLRAWELRHRQRTRRARWDLDVDDHEAVVRFCKEQEVQLVVVGPKQPLVDGLADALVAAGVRCFGPSAMAARLEGSKSFMKELCQKYGIPTAHYATFTDPDAARCTYASKEHPSWSKTDGLAAGKASSSLRPWKKHAQLWTACWWKEGKHSHWPLRKITKQWERATPGPNTGGMGAYSPAPVLTKEMEERVMKTIVKPTIEGMEKEGCPFTGTHLPG
eukprot:jgi/Pico_ML_1/51785/g2633.t1